MNLHKKHFLLAGFIILLGLCSCSKKNEPLIIWTDRSDFASFVELFNKEHEDVKAVLVYKPDSAENFPLKKKEQKPDIVIGTMLKNDRTKRYFCNINSLFKEEEKSDSKHLNTDIFYKNVLDYGKIKKNQYLVPINFNLPAMIFASSSGQYIPEDSPLEISLDQVRDIASAINQKDKNSSYTAMGYAPSWNSEFLYTAAKIFGAKFKKNALLFSYDQEALDSMTKFMRDWTLAYNTSSSMEQDFSFKYLYTPVSKQVLSNKSLFAFTSSAELFSLPEDQLNNLDFRWLGKDEIIPVEDKVLCLGIYRHSSNKSKAKNFLSWFFTEETQLRLLERNKELNLGTSGFGIAGGFSSIKIVNERMSQSYYNSLMGNIPDDKNLLMPEILPPLWDTLKIKVVLPYLLDSSNTDSFKDSASLEERIANWEKLAY